MSAQPRIAHFSMKIGLEVEIPTYRGRPGILAMRAVIRRSRGNVMSRLGLSQLACC